MTNLIKADFNGTNVLFKSDGYLHATAIVKKFGKKINNYTRNEQTKNYIKAITRIRVIDENQLVIIKKGSPSNGGGTWLHPKLAIDFARWLSAEFAVWCDEKIEKILHNVQSSSEKEDRLSTSDDRVRLRQAVSMLVSKKGLVYSEAYTMVNQRFDNDHLDELTVDEVPQAVKYVHELIVSDAINGELMPRVKAKDQSAGLALMKYGDDVKRIQDERLRHVEKLLNEATSALNEALLCSGAIHDGLNESIMHLNFNKDEQKSAEVKAQSHFNYWKSQRSFMA